MVKVYTADYVFPVSGDPIRNGVVEVSEEGEILDLYSKDHNRPVPGKAEKLNGIIVPGFVNAHCHLELSYLKDKIAPHTGLIPFVKNVIQLRKEGKNEDIEAAMARADQEMWDNGIVAVGDISNTEVSKKVKQKSKLFYHTFIELMGFQPEKAKEVFKCGLALKEKFAPLRTSIVPHAPYSVSKRLLRFISNFCQDDSNLLTLHNQETEEENKLYRYKTGKFLDFYKDLQQDISSFRPQARNSIQSLVPLLPDQNGIMLVHNIYTSLKDIFFVHRFGRNVTWCFCPNANLYIEQRLPKIDLFLFGDFKITVGTDSLASNNRLCLLSELKVIHKAFPALPFTQTLAWATLNGAKFLKIDEMYGSIEKGKKPGLNLITNVNGLNLTAESEVRKLV